MRKACDWRGVLAPCLAAAMVALAGCGGSIDGLPREAVAGTVTLDGQPLAAGAIQFFPATKAGGVAVSAGSPVEDGQFSIARDYGLVPGTYKVAINAAESENGDSKTKGQKRKKSASSKDIIPAKYNTQTILTAEIEKGGSAGLKFDLQSK